ncbi:MAG TPA: hypothetical protein VI794_01825 [Patescibacteria group bacterium]|nr:hypothetical protein [Patescibacteria group bacterium]
MVVKGTPLTKDPELKKLGKAYDIYFNAADLKKIGEIRRDIFFFRKPFLKREEALQKHKKMIETLKPLYKNIVEARNTYAQHQGHYRNFLEFSLENNGLPPQNLARALKLLDSLIARIHQALPEPKNKGEFYSVLSTPDFIDELTDKRYSLPDYVIEKLENRIPKLKSLLPRIKFEDVDRNKGGFNEAVYDPKTETATIRTWASKDLQNAISMAHEVGHSVAYLGLAKRGLEPKDKPKYWHEQQAIRTELVFINSLPEKLRGAALGGILLQFTEALFEIETYTNPNQDFDMVYAQAFNRCYKDVKQDKNPFYVLMETNISRPCSSVLQGIIHAEELSRILK